MYLAPLTKSFVSCDERYSTKDAHGVQHILLCDFAQGAPEELVRHSEQFAPSDRKYNTAVDSLRNPGRYIVWSTDMNQRILPRYVISFSLQ